MNENIKRNIIKYNILLLYITNGQIIITFDDIEIEKQKIIHYKNPIFLNDVDIDNIFILKKISTNIRIINTLLVT